MRGFFERIVTSFRNIPVACLIVAALPAGAGSAPAPMLPDTPRGESGRPNRNVHVAIFKEDLPWSGAPASPDQLAEILSGAGIGVAFLDSDELGDARFLNRRLFDVLVLPYGASFPVAAADNFRRYLRERGKFFSTGGYAFDRLLERTPEGWQPVPPPAVPELDLVMWHYDIPAAELRGKGTLTFEGWLKTANVRGPGMAYFAVYQVAADGSLPEWIDLCKVTGSNDWQEHRYSFNVHPKAATISVHAGLFRCAGLACFDDIRLTAERGEVLFHSDFEQAFSSDEAQPRHWHRSHPQWCDVTSGAARSGQRALQAKLDYEVAQPERLNTREGVPEDGLRIAPTQLGLFQADYFLDRVRFAQAAPDQCILNPQLRLEGGFQGYAACGVTGFDQARWVPLLNTYDRYGRLRGAAGSLLRHFAGPYAGSSWAFFGVTNHNLFSESTGPMAEALVQLVHTLAEDTYLASVSESRRGTTPTAIC